MVGPIEPAFHRAGQVSRLKSALRHWDVFPMEIGLGAFTGICDAGPVAGGRSLHGRSVSMGDLDRTRRAMAVCIGAGIAEDTMFRERRCRHMEKPRSSLLSRPLRRLSVSRAFSAASRCLSAVGTGMTSMLRSLARSVRDVDLAEVVNSTTAMGPASSMSRSRWAIAKPQLFIQSGLNTTRSTSFARAHSSANFMAGAMVCPWMKNRSG